MNEIFPKNNYFVNDISIAVLHEELERNCIPLNIVLYQTATISCKIYHSRQDTEIKANKSNPGIKSDSQIT